MTQPLYSNKTRRSDHTFREVGKCKACKKGFARMARQITEITTTYGICGMNTRRNVKFYGSADLSFHGRSNEVCCGKVVQLTRVQGITVPEVPCDARCTGAKGHNCQCSCGGKNH